MAPRRRIPPPAAPAGGRGVTGPNSAMTAFLREQGITAPRPNQRPALPQALPVATVAEEDEENAAAAVEVGEGQGAGAGEDGTNTNAVASGSGAGATASVVLVTAGQAKRKTAVDKKEVEAMKKRKKMEGEKEEARKEGEKDKPKPGRYDSRTPGAIARCGECGRKFTVTKYTSSNPLGKGGVLCSSCSTEGFSNVPRPKSAKPPVKKRAIAKPATEEKTRILPTLQSICVATIGRKIEEIEDLGAIGSINLDKICKIVCKLRALTPENLKLFLNIEHTELSLYDCTNLTDQDLILISKFSPHLERLRLNMCGRLDDAVLEEWGKGLKQIKYLSLYAPYLVTFEQWKKYLSTFGGGRQLEGFGLMQSARFNDDCIQMLVERNPNLFNLQLSELGRLNDLSLSYLHPLKALTTLDISRAGVDQGNVLTDDAVVALIEQVGENLIELVLDQNYLLTDRVLIEAVKVHCPHLRSLSLHSLSLVQSTGVEALFTDWVNTGLTHLNLHRCILLENEAIEAVVSHSGHSLVELDLNSVDEVEETTLKILAKGCPRMRVLDVSFVRSCDDFVVADMMREMKELTTLFVHGNNRVSDGAPCRAGVSIRGQENCKHVEL